MEKDFLDSINVESPCSKSWEEMTGNDQLRFCSHCATDIHNLSAMTRAQAEKLVKSSSGKLCVRYAKSAQGKLMTAPPKFAQITRQSRVAAGVLAASLALSMLAYSQEDETVKPPPNWKQTVKKISQTGESKNDFSTISGTVADENKAFIAGAKVTLRNIDSQKTRYTSTDEDGVYEFTKIEPDVYEIEIENLGFKKLVVTNILVAENVKLEQTAVLEVAPLPGLEVPAEKPLETTEPQINQNVQPEKLLELPKNNQRFFLGMIPGARPEKKTPAEKPKKSTKKKN